MKVTRKGSCAFLFLALTMMVSIRGEDQDGNSYTVAQTNVTSQTSAKLPQGSGQDVERMNKTYNVVVVSNKKRNRGGGGGGGGAGGGGGGGGSWGWGGGGGGGGGGGAAPGGGGGKGGGGGAMGGGGGWGWGGGGGGWWGWGCRRPQRKYNGRGHHGHAHKKNVPANQYYKIGEFAQCTMEGRCQGMRLDCPLHCGGPCFYDCKNMCKAHCRR